MNVLEKILEEIEKAAIKVSTVKGHTYFKAVGTRKIEEIIRSHIADVTDTNVGGNNDYVMFTINEDGIAETYDDTYDIVIHCESESEQKRVIGKLERYQGWIPVEERLPEEGKEVLAQFVVRVVHINNTVDEEVYIHPLYYQNGAWQSFNGVPNGKVEAWRPLPEPYKPEEN